MPCCVFCCHLTSQLDLKPFKQVVCFWFPSLRKVLDRYPLEAKTKITESMPAAPIPPQLNSMPNSSPQSMLQSSESKKAGHLGQVLSGPFMDTFEARPTNWPWPGKGSAQFKKAMYFAPWSPREIFVIRTINGHIRSQANKLTLTRERECTVQKSHVLCSMVP